MQCVTWVLLLVLVLAVPLLPFQVDTQSLNSLPKYWCWYWVGLMPAMQSCRHHSAVSGISMCRVPEAGVSESRVPEAGVSESRVPEAGVSEILSRTQ